MRGRGPFVVLESPQGQLLAPIHAEDIQDLHVLRGNVSFLRGGAGAIAGAWLAGPVGMVAGAAFGAAARDFCFEFSVGGSRFRLDGMNADSGRELVETIIRAQQAASMMTEAFGKAAGTVSAYFRNGGKRTFVANVSGDKLSDAMFAEIVALGWYVEQAGIHVETDAEQNMFLTGGDSGRWASFLARAAE